MHRHIFTLFSNKTKPKYTGKTVGSQIQSGYERTNEKKYYAFLFLTYSHFYYVMSLLRSLCVHYTHDPKMKKKKKTEQTKVVRVKAKANVMCVVVERLPFSV